MSGPIFSEDLVGTVRGGNVRVGLFSRRELSESELPGGELSGGNCPRGNLPVIASNSTPNETNAPLLDLKASIFDSQPTVHAIL